MNTYKAYYRSKETEVQADTAYEAQTKAAAVFKARKQFEVTVMLVAKGDEAVVHMPLM